MAVGNEATINAIRLELAYRPINLANNARVQVTANNTDRIRSANNIYAVGAGISIPFPAGAVGENITRSSIATFVSLLTKTVSVHTFNFLYAGAGTSYTKRSVWVRPENSNNNYNFIPASGAEITNANLNAANVSIRGLVNSNRNTVVATFTYCHSNCHASCHGSRGRR